MQKLYVLKIGGSVATEKGRETPRVRRALLKKIFEKCAHALKIDPSLSLIIVHGAGSFGHTLAHTYRLREGTYAHKDGKQGAAYTRASVQRLNTEILDIALSAGLPTLTLHTGALIAQKRGHIETLHTAPLTSALKEKYVPILYGDMVFDSALGMSVCSGDAIVADIVKYFPISKVFFASDVDGIYTKDPHRDTHAILLETLSLRNMSEVTLGASHNTDVTGGLKGKIDACKDLFKKSSLKEIHVFNGLAEENFAKIFAGEAFPHTTVVK